MIPVVSYTAYVLCKMMIGARRIKKVNGVVNKIVRITEQNQWSKELDKPTANDSRETTATGRTGAGTTPSNDTNLRAGKTHWVNIRQ